MIWKLVQKDLLAYRRYIFFGILLPAIFWNIFFIYPYFRWSVFIIYSNLAIVAATTYFIFSEKKQSLETLVGSFPVTRTQIVYARYLLALTLTVSGILLYYLNGYVCDLIYSETVAHFDKISHLKNLFLSLFLLSIFISLHYPVTFRFGMTGMVFSLLIAVSVSIFLTIQLFEINTRTWSPYFNAGDKLQIILICFGIFIVPLLSVWLSKHI